MIRLKEAVIVEGRYDQIKLAQIIDAPIIPTHGYRIFKDKAALNMIRKLAETRGLIILTDSDAAGFRIRRYLQGSIPNERIRHVYLPQIVGRESRKDRDSAEGLLGVEGVADEIILAAFHSAGITPVGTSEVEPAGEPVRPVTKTDFVAMGLSGAPDSGERRRRVTDALGLPGYLSANALLGFVNTTMDYTAFSRLVEELFAGE